MPNKTKIVKKTDYTTTKSLDDIHGQTQTLLGRIGENEKRLRRYLKKNDKVHTKEVKLAQKREQAARAFRQEAQALRAEGKAEEAAEKDGKAADEEVEAARIRNTAEKRRYDRVKGYYRTRKSLQWALAATLAMTAAVGAGHWVNTPDPDGDLDFPVDVEIPAPPHVEGDPLPAESDEDGSGDGSDASDGGSESSTASAGQAEGAEGATGIFVVAAFVGDGDDITSTKKEKQIGARAGVSYTISRLDKDGATPIVGESNDTKRGVFHSLAPGTYQLTYDDSGFNSINCKGKYTAIITLEEGQRFTGTAYLKNQTKDGEGISFGEFCVGVRPAEGS